MRAALGGRYVVDVGKDVVGVAVVILNGDLYKDIAGSAGKMNRRIEQGRFIAVEVAHKVA
ncbi:hypothetical protein SDC9_74367 [bioreactor metagenome]|uniref:Uncharacterized protein n=1 Tax=bioreactor metagenome TaxID=1076179 RepID=A0A644YGW2_9ZZZZ